MVDTHTHILPQVDDGSNSFEDSIKMINKSLELGVNHIILTPHAFSPYMQCKNKDEIILIYEDFREKVRQLNIDVNLYLGQEITYHPNLFEYFKRDKLLTLNDSNNILLELPYDSKLKDLDETIYNFQTHDHNVILAHIERYDYYSIKELIELKNQFAYFQINASSLRKKSKYYKKANKLLKLGLVNFIGSDIHHNRTNRMKEAYNYITNKFGEDYARRIFFENPKNIIKIPI